jgi:hypothetical protein
LPKPRGRKANRVGLRVAVVVVLIVGLAAGLAYLVLGHGPSSDHQKPIILYVNQGNGVVNGSGFGTMLGFMSSEGFNTVFFQVYRSGHLLFSPRTLGAFVNQTHQAGLRIFFVLYITNSSQALPVSIFGLHQDGVSLDMSALNSASQLTYLAELKSHRVGETAVTTTDMTSALNPDLLVIETYGPGLKGYIRSGVVASVGVFATTSEDDYKSQLQYALQNSDGVMVFDYYGLVKSGY